MQPALNEQIERHSGPGDRRMPDFLVVGSPKSGTTSLYKHLCRRADIFMSTPKEMSFFSKDEVYANGLDWYAELFRGARPDQLCGEGSTTYSRWPTYPDTVDRIAETLPGVKIVYMVRRPVDRLYSFYAHRMRERVTMGLDEFLQETPEALHSGLYMSQVERFLGRFRRDQIHVMLLDDLKNDPQAALDGLAGFLGLPPGDCDADGDVIANRGEGHFAATKALASTAARIKRAPIASALVRALPAGVRRGAFRWAQQGPLGAALRRRHNQGLTPLDDARRRQLYALLSEDLNRFEEFLGRDLSHWKELP